MKRIFGNLTANLYPDSAPVVTIGMFDGVHRGHQEVIHTAVAIAREQNAPAIAITFDVHPRALRKAAPPQICSLEHRLRLLEGCELDAAWVLSFNEELAQVSALAFCRDYLLAGLHAQGVVLGDTGRFGHKGEGSSDFVARSGLPLWARRVNPVFYAGTAISSSEIRTLVRKGELECASAMLGRRVSVMGTVMPGRQLGRTIGFPTLNIDPHHELHPPAGVYATLARCGDSYWQSVTNIGHRPTVEHITPDDILVETHLFDFSGNLYNQEVEVLFISRIRAEERFSSLQELQAQIERDCIAARQILVARVAENE